MTGIRLAPTAVPAPPRGPFTPVRHRVVDRVVELADVVTLTLEPVDADLPPARPGQFLMLWAPGIGEVPISVSRAPDGAGRIGHTIRAVGAVTRALCSAEVGTVLGARGPYGTAWPLEVVGDRDLLAVAGGIGLAPLRPVVDAARVRPSAPGRTTLVVGARHPDQLLYRRELLEWGAGGDLGVSITVDVAGPDWDGDVGVVTRLVPGAVADPDRTVALVCGPEPMMRFTALALLDVGVDPADIYVSLERNMMCGVAQCGHCQLGPAFVCREGPVLDWATAAPLLEVRER